MFFLSPKKNNSTSDKFTAWISVGVSSAQCVSQHSFCNEVGRKLQFFKWFIQIVLFQANLKFQSRICQICLLGKCLCKKTEFLTIVLATYRKIFLLCKNVLRKYTADKYSDTPTVQKYTVKVTNVYAEVLKLEGTTAILLMNNEKFIWGKLQ